MNKSPVEMLAKLALVHSRTLHTSGAAQILHFQRNGLNISVTVPLDVLEWFVDASENDSIAATHWWCDYDGYDNTPRNELTSMMASDIEKTVGGLFNRELRLTKQPTSWFSKILRPQPRYQLDWKIDGQWEEVSP